MTSGRKRRNYLIRHPAVWAGSAVLWILTLVFCGVTLETLLFCLLVTVLPALSIHDWRYREIPIGYNLYIAALGAVRILLHPEQWLLYAAGFFCISTLLLITYLITKGRGVGGGDIKLMAVAGLFLGWKLVTVAFLSGGLYACVIHIARKVSGKEDTEFALGPYLSCGILTALWFGDILVQWYI